LNNTDLPGYRTDRLKQLRDIVLQFRPDASIEFTEGYLTESTGFFVVATIDVDDIDDFNPIEEALLEPLAEIHLDEDLAIFVELVPTDSEKAWGGDGIATKSTADVAP